MTSDQKVAELVFTIAHISHQFEKQTRLFVDTIKEHHRMITQIIDVIKLSQDLDSPVENAVLIHIIDESNNRILEMEEKYKNG